MRTLEDINKDIDRCQLQIIAIYELTPSEQQLIENLIVLEGFQRKLKFLLNERSIQTSAFTELGAIQVNGARAVLPNGSEQTFMYGGTFTERAFKTNSFSIQQLTNPDL